MTSINRIATPAPARKPILLGAAATLILLALNLTGGGLVESLLLLSVATLVSEDLTCIVAGQLVHRGELSAAVAVIGCLVGIFIGDLALFGGGRIFRPALAGRFSVQNQNVPRLVLLARFIPGTRLPIYLAMGATRVDFVRFSFWALMGAILWTPLLVLLVAHLGDLIAGPVSAWLGQGWIAVLCAILSGMLLLKVSALMTSEIGRAKLVAGVSRLWRWEFWPSWLFYLPLLPYIIWLSIRHRGFLTITAANPGIPHGGFVGESKYQILTSLQGPQVSPTTIVRGGERFDRIVQERGWGFPLVLKPDAGQRGAGVKRVHTLLEAQAYLQANPGPTLVQPCHPGPFEAGVFYYRFPGQRRGRILSITDKRFPFVVGDGQSTLEQLIWRHRRHRMQARVFLTRHAGHASRVLGQGERFALAMAGNHCQGTLFRDGSHLITPELERAIDDVARTFDGFYFGRFDLRYTDASRFMAGEDFTIIELNGITSESTNLYDPGWSLIRAYRQLFTQWRILFAIGRANRRRGYPASRMLDLLRDIFGFYRNRRTPLLAD